jgi:hypothetical protein
MVPAGLRYLVNLKILVDGAGRGPKLAASPRRSSLADGRAGAVMARS